jgi:hypothetical protein
MPNFGPIYPPKPLLNPQATQLSQLHSAHAAELKTAAERENSLLLVGVFLGCFLMFFWGFLDIFFFEIF